MPLGTDLSRLLTKEEPATVQEAESIRMELNRLQSQVSQLSGLIDARGNLDANIFSHKSGQFSVLPGESASMMLSGDSTPQTIPDNDATVITFDADADLSAAELRFSWAHGIRRDVSTGEFFLEGVPEETIWEFRTFTMWDALPTTSWRVYVLEKDTATGAMVLYEDSTLGWDIRTIMLTARKAATSWQLQVLQNSGGAASKDLGQAIFQVKRIR